MVDLPMNRDCRKSFKFEQGFRPRWNRRQKILLSPGWAIFAGCKLREEATRLARKQKKAKLPNGKTLTGFTKQFTCSAPEPIFPTGTKAPKLTAAMLRVASTVADSLRFMGTINVRLRKSSLSMNRTRNSLEMNGAIEDGSWPQLTSKFWRCSLSMNQPRHRIGAGFGKAALKTHALQTLRDRRAAPNRAKRLECVRFIGAFRPPRDGPRFMVTTRVPRRRWSIPHVTFIEFDLRQAVGLQ